jgi:UDP-N-acetylmuramoyl-tripeptide--D-alanyl-D-alanine ligase
LAAATIGKYFKLPEKQIVEALSNYEPNLNRSQFVKTENNKLIVDAYNANPTSMEAALKNFSNLIDNNKIVILGGMKELGDESLKHHQRIVDLINSLKLDSVFLIGDEFSQVTHSFRKYSTVDELNSELQINKINNSTILIKGSRANKLEMVVPFL